MSSYIGKHATLYDIFYKEKDYQGEVEKLHQWIQDFGKKPSNNLLELACGTGTHSLLLSKHGYTISATDYSEDMINAAKEKNSSNNVIFNAQDMLLINEFEKYDAAFCLFDSIGYVQTNESVNKVFNNVYNALHKDGLFIFEFWHGAPMIKSYDPLRVKNFKNGDKSIQRISETTIDYATQTCSVKYTISEFDENSSKYSHLVETQKNRYFMLQEMKLFIENNNFKLIKTFDGFSAKETIDDSSWHIVAICKK